MDGRFKWWWVQLRKLRILREVFKLVGHWTSGSEAQERLMGRQCQAGAYLHVDGELGRIHFMVINGKSNSSYLKPKQ